MKYYCNECGEYITPGVYDYSMDHFNRPLCMECQDDEDYDNSNNLSKPQNEPTPQAFALSKALSKEGIKNILEYNDGFKSVDIGIPWARLYVEVDGDHHFYNFNQWERDQDRDYYSNLDGFETIRVPNFEVESDVKQVAKYIAMIARARFKRFRA